MPIRGSCQCPCCKIFLSPRSIHVHTSECSEWLQKFGGSWPKFRFDRDPSLYSTSVVEGEDYVRCYECYQHGWDFRFSRLVDHLKFHGLSTEEYEAKYPGKPVRLSSTYELRKASVRTKYGVDNVFQSEEVKEKSKRTLLEKYGVDSPLRSEEILRRLKETNLERYGVENPFASEEIQEKIKETTLRKYGVEYANQSSEVRSKTIASSLERYGVSTYLQTEEFKERFKKTSEERYGVDHPMKAEEVKAKLKSTFLVKYGVTNAAKTPEVRKKISESMITRRKEPTVGPCLCGHMSTSLTQMKRHRSTCEVWKARDRGKVQMAALARTLSSKYGEGVKHPMDVPGAKESLKKTNLAKYGAEFVVSKESCLYDQIQERAQANHISLFGQDNPFSRPEVQEKIRSTNLLKYGTIHPQKCLEVREKTRKTNVERYGVPETLSVPKIRGIIRKTNQEKYGGPAPSNSPDVVERTRQTNLKRWGVEWTCQHPTVRQKQYESMLGKYGSHFFASEEGRRVVREALVQKYGVNHPSKIEGFWERTVATFVRKYGVTHPLLLSEFLEKRGVTCLSKYGVENPTQSPEIYAKLTETVRDRYGVECVFQLDEIKKKSIETRIERYGSPYVMRRQLGPNLPERLLHGLAPELIYTGNGTFWRWLPKIGHHKNPDFILPGSNPENMKEGIKVVELFGDYWHSRMFTGKSNLEHEDELIEAYADIGIQCIVVWESDVKKKKDEVKVRLSEFLSV